MPAAHNVMILYTGGTIGMQPSAAGLAPAGGFAARIQAEQAQQALSLPTWQCRELTPLLDSANMTPSQWLQMRDAVVEAIEAGHDAILLLHGTDTLAYSAAALRLLMPDVPVPVLITGAMQPAGTPAGDAWPNLFGALATLAQDCASGVQVFFNGQLMHGARVSKRSSTRFDAFAPVARPRQAPRLATLPATLSWQQPRRHVPLALISLYPGISASAVSAQLENVNGAVIECYGSGTGPADNRALLDALRNAQQRGVVLLGISQCSEGAVHFGTYAAGSALAACGVISGGGMTREAALGKLFSLLGAGLKPSECEQLLTEDLCGEMCD
ncbi:asparaginase [Atopomonas sediminilitoris]|uniref:asparaginase n=1 Tax=Atopomonas sediminilitoris TaxID=2919919 RepID=UPI001F4E3075|nr:asparaginase [Atopomonas sediminilitoris]MCJ8168168.1 asparaginase [Atopomonas sediminilitoris]